MEHVTLRSPRLGHRVLEERDLDAFHALITDAHVRRYLCDGQTLPREWAADAIAASQRLAGQMVGFPAGRVASSGVTPAAMCYLQGMTAFHVRQSLRASRALSFWALAALLAAASACGKITAVQPVDAAPVPPDAGAIVDAFVPSDANFGALVTLQHANSLTVQLVDCLSCMNDTMPVTHADNSWFLVLDLAAAGIVGDFQVAHVQVGVNESLGANGTQPAEVNLYTLPAGAELVRANLQFITTRAHDVPNLQLELMDMPISARIPAGSTLVAEIFVPDGESSGNLFKMGCNRLGATGPSYIEAPTCVEIEKITSFESLGTTDKNLVMAVQGYDLGVVQDLR